MLKCLCTCVKIKLELKCFVVVLVDAVVVFYKSKHIINNNKLLIITQVWKQRGRSGLYGHMNCSHWTKINFVKEPFLLHESTELYYTDASRW